MEKAPSTSSKPTVLLLLTILWILYLGSGLALFSQEARASVIKTHPMLEDITQGALRILHGERIVESPLRHTDVDVHLSGFIARVNVRQTFENPYNEPIEAVYVFPLPHKAAVDRLTMQVGARRIVGVIKRREDARGVYEQAVAEGKTAGLLEQERPNIFTQSVGNIPPRGTVVMEFSYVDVLPYDLGTYEFHFPLVVGPRYLPGSPISLTPHLLPELPGSVGEIDALPAGPAPSGTGWSPDTDRVPDASRITPPVLKPGHRTGHDIDLVLELNAGVPIRDLQVINHEAELRYAGESRARITLSPADAIPNKDFVVRYQVAGKKPQMAVLSHAPRDADGCFMLMIQPGLNEELAKAPRREVVFLIDVSGSMRGRPTEKVKATLRAFFDLARPSDTFQIVTFASRAQKLFAAPVAATGGNIARALKLTGNMRGGGGTEMLQGIRTVLDAPVDPERVRIVVMLTDGYIGNEAEIIEEVGQKSGDQIRVWTVGIGSSPNRFLLDGVAAQGGGMSAVIELGTDPKELVARMVERIHRAQLAHIGVEWHGLSVYETYPRRIPELWAGRPVILFGRYGEGGTGTIQIHGTAEGRPLSFSLDVALPRYAPDHDVLVKVWARQKIEDLSATRVYGHDDPDLVEQITRIALEHSLMSPYTSFVAVDETVAQGMETDPYGPRRMGVPVPLPDGVDYEGVFGVNRKTDELHRLFGAGRDAESPDPAGPGVREFFRGLFNDQRTRKGGPLPLKRSLQTFTPHRAPESALESAKEELMAEMKAEPEKRFSGQNTDRMNALPVGPGTAKPHEEATEALHDAQRRRRHGDLEGALRRVQEAFALETVYLLANPDRDDGTRAAAERLLTVLPQAIIDKRKQEEPALSGKLDLVLRNLPLEEALARIVKAAGLNLKVIPGSLSGAAAQSGERALRIRYLDLRGQTVAQALDRILGPCHLRWEIDESGAVVVGKVVRPGRMLPPG